MGVSVLLRLGCSYSHSTNTQQLNPDVATGLISAILVAPFVLSVFIVVHRKRKRAIGEPSDEETPPEAPKMPLPESSNVALLDSTIVLISDPVAMLLSEAPSMLLPKPLDEATRKQRRQPWFDNKPVDALYIVDEWDFDYPTPNSIHHDRYPSLENGPGPVIIAHRTSTMMTASPGSYESERPASRESFETCSLYRAVFNAGPLDEITKPEPAIIREANSSGYTGVWP